MLLKAGEEVVERSSLLVPLTWAALTLVSLLSKLCLRHASKSLESPAESEAPGHPDETT
jgi:hypothetical protein